MLLTNMPMFELIQTIFETKKIEKWTANDFWNALKLSKKERTNSNRHRMYRLLRKLVIEGFLTKEIHPYNHRYSTFSETEKLDHLRGVTDLSSDIMGMRLSQEETKKSILLLEKQLEGFDVLEAKFPNSVIQINIQKSKFLDELINLTAYNAALNYVLTSI